MSSHRTRCLLQLIWQRLIRSLNSFEISSKTDGDRLQESLSSARLFSGDIEKSERYSICNEWRRGKFDILISTTCGAVGINNPALTPIFGDKSSSDHDIKQQWYTYQGSLAYFSAQQRCQKAYFHQLAHSLDEPKWDPHVMPVNYFMLTLMYR